MKIRLVERGVRLPVLGSMTVIGLLVVFVSVLIAGLAVSFVGVDSTASHAGPLIAASGVVIATVALAGFD